MGGEGFKSRSLCSLFVLRSNSKHRNFQRLCGYRGFLLHLVWANSKVDVETADFLYHFWICKYLIALTISFFKDEIIEFDLLKYMKCSCGLCEFKSVEMWWKAILLRLFSDYPFFQWSPDLISKNAVCYLCAHQTRKFIQRKKERRRVALVISEANILANFVGWLRLWREIAGLRFALYLWLFTLHNSKVDWIEAKILPFGRCLATYELVFWTPNGSIFS